MTTTKTCKRRRCKDIEKRGGGITAGEQDITKQNCIAGDGLHMQRWDTGTEQRKHRGAALMNKNKQKNK